MKYQRVNRRLLKNWHRVTARNRLNIPFPLSSRIASRYTGLSAQR